MNYPKLKPSKQKKASNNPIPTVDDICNYHGTPYAETHEVFYGNKRQLSIKYNLQIKVCRNCHVNIHNNKKLDLELKRKYQMEFEIIHSHEEFMRIFGRSYLDI